jgi:hypothetical protein
MNLLLKIDVVCTVVYTEGKKFDFVFFCLELGKLYPCFGTAAGQCQHL